MKGSIVIPVYNEEVFIEDFFKNLYANIVSVSDFEFVFVDDGSNDYSLKIMKKIANDYSNIKVVSFDKNYGKQIAIAGGMKQCTGDFVVVCPINPYNSYLAINEAVKKWQEGYQIVRAIRSNKKQKKLTTQIKDYMFDEILKLFKIKEKVLQKATIELYDRDVVEVLKVLEEKNMLLRSFDGWVDWKIFSFKYNPGEVDILTKAEYAKLENGYNLLRQKEKVKREKVIKTRLYAPSLYASVTCLMFFAMSIILLAVFSSNNAVPFMFKLFLWFFMITSLITGFLFGCRAWMMKRIGVVPYISKDASLYNIKEKYESK